MLRLIFLLFLFFSQLIIFGQEITSQKLIYSTFDQETIKDIEELNTDKPVVLEIGAEILPEWFYDTPKSSNSYLYAIGISDPFISDKLSAQQAYQRALFLIDLMTGTEISGVSDNYADRNGKKYEEIDKFKGQLWLIGKISVVDSFYTRFKEKIMLIRFDKMCTDTLKLKSSVDYYKSQIETDAGIYTFVNLTLSFKQDTVFSYYNYVQYGDYFSIKSLFVEQDVEIPNGLYEYTLKNFDSEKSNSNKIVTLPNKGLWFGYLVSFIEELSLKASNLRSLSRSTGQFKQDFEDANLSREIIKNNLSFKINKVTIADNKFGIDISLIK